MDARTRYELIRPIVNGEKTAKQVHQETQVPLSSIYRYLSRYRDSGGQVESLADQSRAPLSNPKWLSEEEKTSIVSYKLHHPSLSTRQIAEGLAAEGILEIHNRTVANVLKEGGLSSPFCQLVLSH